MNKFLKFKEFYTPGDKSPVDMFKIFRCICTAPYQEVGIYMGNKIIPCCNLILKSDNYLIGKELDKLTDIYDLYNLPFIKKMREQFDQREIPELCLTCPTVYNTSIINSHLASFIIPKNEPIVKKLKIIKLHSFYECCCECKMCGSVRASSMDSFDVSSHDIQEKRSSADSSKKLIRLITEKIEQNKWDIEMSLSLAGGEPLFDMSIDSLSNAIKYTQTPPILAITTSLASNNKTAQDRLDTILKLPKQNIYVSIDSIPKTHDYIRNSKWSTIFNNLERIKQSGKKIKIQSLLSILSLRDFYEFVTEHVPTFNIQQINFLNCEGTFSLNNIHPDLLKEYLEFYTDDKIEKMDNSLKHISCNDTCKNIIEKLRSQSKTMSLNKKMWKIVCKTIYTLDIKQNKNVFDYYPEFEKFWISKY